MSMQLLTRVVCLVEVHARPPRPRGMPAFASEADALFPRAGSRWACLCFAATIAALDHAHRRPGRIVQKWDGSKMSCKRMGMVTIQLVT